MTTSGLSLDLTETERDFLKQYENDIFKKKSAWD
jgi:hypothetical protein